MTVPNPIAYNKHKLFKFHCPNTTHSLMTAWSDLSGFVQRNKPAAIATAVAVSAATGLGLYYMYNNSASLTGFGSATSPQSADNVAGAASSDKKKKKKKNKKNKSKDSEKSPSPVPEPSTETSLHGFALTRDAPDAPAYPVIPDDSVLSSASEETRKSLASSFKAAGNHEYQKKNFDAALKHYSDAIKCDPKDPIFYSNKAACYAAQEKHAQVVHETTKALEIKDDYIKCLSRRAVAYEKLQQYPDAVLDYTAACILTDFADKTLNNAVDRNLRLNSEKLAKTDAYSKSDKLPSHSFCSAYLASFGPRDLPASIENAQENTPEYDMKLAFAALKEQTSESYEQAMNLFNSATTKFSSLEEEKHELDAEAYALALEYRSTFRFLTNNVDDALSDIDRSLKLHPTVQAYVKRSSVHMERGNITSANQDFEAALKLNPDSADVYYHRAQIAFLTQDFEAAIKDYKKSVELDPTFLFSHIQLAVSQYRHGSSSEALKIFNDLLAKFENSSDVHNYYAEVLLDQGQVDRSVEEFDKAIALETKKPNGAINVLPMVNKALAVFSKTQDIAAADALCRKAVALDPASDVAVSTLAQLCLQQNKVEEAVELFDKTAKLSRTEGERVQALSFAGAAKTQLRITQERPALRARLEYLTRQQQMTA